MADIVNNEIRLNSKTLSFSKETNFNSSLVKTSPLLDTKKITFADTLVFDSNKSEMVKEFYPFAMEDKFVYSNSTFEFDSSIEEEDKIKFTEFDITFSKDVVGFNSGLKEEEAFGNLRKPNVTFSSIVDFNNSQQEFKGGFDITYSEGIFPFVEQLNYLIHETSSYETLLPYVENLSLEYYWFDNSVPSKLDYFQTNVIPLGFKANEFQFSIGFPTYQFDIEVNVAKISQSDTINTEWEFFPLTDTEYGLNLETLAGYYGVELDLEWVRGTGSFNYFNFEVERLAGLTVYPLNLEVYNIFKASDAINLEVITGYNTEYLLNGQFEVNEFIHDTGFDIEVYGKLIAYDNLNLEIYRDESWTRPLNLEWVSLQGTDYVANLEFNRVYHDDYSLGLEYIAGYGMMEELPLETNLSINSDNILNTEYSVVTVNQTLNLENIVVYHDSEPIDIEFDIPTITTNYLLPIEYNVPEITHEWDFNLEFSRVYHTQYDMNMEYGIYELTHNWNLGLEFYTKLDDDFIMDFEWIRPLETKSNYQAYIVPFGYKEEFFQFGVKAVSYERLNLEVDVPNLPLFRTLPIEYDTVILMDEKLDLEVSIPTLWSDNTLPLEVSIPTLWTDASLPLEAAVVYHDNYAFNTETYIEINKDFILPLEYNVENVSHTWTTNLEFLSLQKTDYQMNIEYDNVINATYEMQLEYVVDKLVHEWNFNIEQYIEINADYSFDLEFALSTLNKTLNLEIDVLDLVYYFVRKGYNILPWFYSDGYGKWDTNVNNNWDKESVDKTTLDSGFYNQLQDKGLTIPEKIQFSDNKLENFGTIIDGVISKNTELSDKFLYYKSIDEDHTLVLGKRKRDSEEVVTLKKGNNLIIWDGEYNSSIPRTFNNEIRQHIEEQFNYVSIWNQKEGTWFTITKDETFDHELYFTTVIDGTEQPMPFILNINVIDETTFTIYR